jgi:photosystem II stability/assembly factor-like uncharacterized protein
MHSSSITSSFVVSLLLKAFTVDAQWMTQTSGITERLRGVSAVSQTVAWASGSHGTYVRTTDGGTAWQAAKVPEADSLDFRDVEAFDANTAYLLSIGAGPQSRIYKTHNGGRNWILQFKNSNAKAFFDAMAFWDQNNGIALSDPVDGHFLLIRTSDGGKTWQEVPARNLPAALPNEAAFAASGTCLTVQGRRHVWFATGGGAARVFRSTDRGATWAVASTPIRSDNASSGIFSISFKNEKRGVIVGGDFRKENAASEHVAITTDGGKTWKLVAGELPQGFRSSVVYAPGLASSTWIAVGPSGSDYSPDNGLSWESIDTNGFHAVSFAGATNTGWAVGENGRIAKYAGTQSQVEKR